jgi:hypothetical protein
VTEDGLENLFRAQGPRGTYLLPFSVAARTGPPDQQRHSSMITSLITIIPELAIGFPNAAKTLPTASRSV